MEGTTHESGLPQAKALVHQSRNVFVIAMTICAVLSVNLTVHGVQSVGVASCFVPLLFWSLVAVVYAFYSLASTNARLMQQMGNKMVWERMKGLRQLAAIKERLRSHTAPDPE